ncbi:MAG: hypothetical protein D6813_00385 [Calditrichaeota bacterium]|nr:MAG: hypothetical protein D6813_00385 [Calditrichota bacterium]
MFTKKIYVPILLLLFLFFACEKQKTNPFEGAWKMIKGTYSSDDTKIETTEEQRFCIKIMGPKYFAVVEMFKHNPDSLFFAAVGTYEFTKDKYIEKYTASNVGYQIGSKRTFDYTLENDLWTLTGKEKDMELYEEWMRIKE